MKEGVLTLEEGTLAYLRGGEGPLVVFSHTLGPLAWGPLERLRESCTVAVPVWERSTIPAGARTELGWFEALATAMGFEQAALCAWSMAGPAAIHYAAEKPPRLSHLVLVDVAGLGTGFPPLRWGDVPHVVLTRLLGRPTRGFVRLMWKNWVRRKSVDTKPLEAATYRFLRAEPDALQGPPDDDEATDALDDLLPAIEVPTLVLAGRHSPVLGPRFGRSTVAALPRGRLIVFEESSHTLQLEEPDEFQDAVAAFVNDRT